MLYQPTTATRKILSLKKRLRGVAGGTSASKTISIIMWLIDYAQSAHGEVISVVSETLPHLKRGAIRDFLNIMEGHGYFKEDRWNRSDFVYTFETGTKLEFFSADQPDKVRGPRRDVLFINEANNISYETYTQLEIRTRKIIWLDWNPVSEFWWYSEVMPHSVNFDFITLTYKDNEALEPGVVQAIEARQYNKSWWKVYGEGQLGEAEGRVYTGWALIDDVPFEARLERYGLDFGFTNDPTVIVAIYRYNGAFIIDEIVYQKGLSNRSIADLLLAQPKAEVKADSAEPKSIDEIYKFGVNITPAIKGPGSVYQGIQYVKDQKISITKRSERSIKAYRNYLFRTDKDGRVTNDPDDTIHEWSNSMDAIRYGLDSFRPHTDYQALMSEIPKEEWKGRSWY